MDSTLRQNKLLSVAAGPGYLIAQVAGRNFAADSDYGLPGGAPATSGPAFVYAPNPDNGELEWAQREVRLVARGFGGSSYSFNPDTPRWMPLATVNGEWRPLGFMFGSYYIFRKHSPAGESLWSGDYYYDSKKRENGFGTISLLASRVVVLDADANGRLLVSGRRTLKDRTIQLYAADGKRLATVFSPTTQTAKFAPDGTIRAFGGGLLRSYSSDLSTIEWSTPTLVNDGYGELDVAATMAVDADGNTILGTFDAPRGFLGGFAKWNPDGELLWAKNSLAGRANFPKTNVAVAPDGGIFFGIPSFNNERQVEVAKHDANGDFLWAVAPYSISPYDRWVPGFMVCDANGDLAFGCPPALNLSNGDIEGFYKLDGVTGGTQWTRPSGRVFDADANNNLLLTDAFPGGHNFGVLTPDGGTLLASFFAHLNSAVNPDVECDGAFDGEGNIFTSGELSPLSDRPV